MTIRSYILLLALGGCLATRAQEHPEKPFISPFDFPLTLSGNFGELRANHLKRRGRLASLFIALPTAM